MLRLKKTAGFTAGGMAQGAVLGAAFGGALGGLQGFIEANRAGAKGKERIRAALDEGIRSALMGSLIGTAVSGSSKSVSETISNTALTKAVDVFASRAAKAVAPQEDKQRFFKQAGESLLIASMADELHQITLAKEASWKYPAIGAAGLGTIQLLTPKKNETKTHKAMRVARGALLGAGLGAWLGPMHRSLADLPPPRAPVPPPRVATPPPAAPSMPAATAPISRRQLLEID